MNDMTWIELNSSQLQRETRANVWVVSSVNSMFRTLLLLYFVKVQITYYINTIILIFMFRHLDHFNELLIHVFPSERPRYIYLQLGN